MNIQSHFRLKNPNLLYIWSKDDFNMFRDGDDTTCSGNSFQIGATLFRKKLCLKDIIQKEIVTACKKLFRIFSILLISPTKNGFQALQHTLSVVLLGKRRGLSKDQGS